MAFTAISNGYERVSDSEQERMERFLEQKNSDINITEVGSSQVEVNNTGSITLHVNDTYLVTNGTFEDPDSTSVEGNVDTTVWAPGEQLTFTLSSSDPTRVKVITETGVSDTRTGVN